MKKNYLKMYQEGGEMEMPQEQEMQQEEQANPETQLQEMIMAYMQEPNEELGNQIIAMVAEMLGITSPQGQEEAPVEMILSQKFGGIIIPKFRMGGGIPKYQAGVRGLQNRGQAKTTVTPLPNKGKLTETYQGQRFDSAAGTSPYTMSGKGQSVATQQGYNQRMDTEDFSSLGSNAEEIANYATKDKVKAQLATQAKANAIADQLANSGRLRPGQTIQEQGFTFSMDENGVVTNDRSALNSKLGLDAGLKYRTGQFGSKEIPPPPPNKKPIVQPVKIKGQVNLKFRDRPYNYDIQYNSAVNSETGQTVPAVGNTGEGNVSSQIPVTLGYMEMDMSDYASEIEFRNKRGAVLEKTVREFVEKSPQLQKAIQAALEHLRDLKDKK